MDLRPCFSMLSRGSWWDPLVTSFHSEKLTVSWSFTEAEIPKRTASHSSSAHRSCQGGRQLKVQLKVSIVLCFHSSTAVRLNSHLLVKLLNALLGNGPNKASRRAWISWVTAATLWSTFTFRTQTLVQVQLISCGFVPEDSQLQSTPKSNGPKIKQL